MLQKLKSNAWLVFFSAIFIFSPILRFSWDFATQCIFHALILSAFLVSINYYKISFTFKKEGIALLFFLAALFSIIGATEKANVRNNLLVLLDSLIILYLLRLLSFEQKKQLFKIPVLVGCCFSFILLFYFVKAPFQYFTDGVQLIEYLINPNIVAGYLLLSFFLAFSYWDTTDDKNTTHFKFLTFFIFLGIFLTKSRTAIFVSSLFGGYYFYNYVKDNSKILKLFVIFLVLVLFYLTSLKSNMGTYLFDRIIWWKAAWKMFIENPVKGIGWGNFENLYLYFRPALSINSIYAHNILFQLLSETGLIGFLSFSGFLYFCLAKIYSAKEYIFPRKEVIIICLAGFFAFNILDYSFYIPAHMMLFGAVLGAGFKSGAQIREKPLFNPLILLFLICSISLPIIFFFSASIHYQKGLVNLANNNFSEAEKELKKAIKYDSSPSVYFSKSAEIYFKLFSMNKKDQNLNTAITFQKEAVKRSNFNSTYWSDLSWLYWTKNDKESAVKTIKKAVEYDRLNPHYQSTLKKFIGNLNK